jgi:hypothetical protein
VAIAAAPAAGCPSGIFTLPRIASAAQTQIHSQSTVASLKSSNHRRYRPLRCGRTADQRALFTWVVNLVKQPLVKDSTLVRETEGISFSAQMVPSKTR